MERTLNVYRIKYASGILANRGGNQEQIIYSNEELKTNQFVVIEHSGYGIFIGQIIEDVSNTDYEDYSDKEIRETLDYKYVQNIDLSSYFNEIEKQKRKEELKRKMQERFKVIDEEKKYEYYAALDGEMKSMYDEYKNL